MLSSTRVATVHALRRSEVVNEAVCNSRSYDHSPFDMTTSKCLVREHYAILPWRLHVTLLHYVIDAEIWALIFSSMIVQHTLDSPPCIRIFCYLPTENEKANKSEKKST